MFKDSHKNTICVLKSQIKYLKNTIIFLNILKVSEMSRIFVQVR